MIDKITEIFSNREISLAIWFFIILIFILSKKEVRISVLNVIKVFFGKKIFSVYLLMTLYVFLLISFLKVLGFWNFSLLKETIYWYFGVAFVSLVRANKVNQEENYFKKMLNDNLKLIIILEFVTALYSFSLIVELILVPIMLLITMLSAFTEVKKEYLQVKKAVDGILSFFGIIIIIFSVYKISTQFQSFANINNLTTFLLPPILTFLFIPFIYFFALLMSYEIFFVRLKFFIKDDDDRKYAQRKIFCAFHFKLRELNRFSKEYYNLNENCNNDIVKAIKVFKKARKQK